jgi:hypothetical protein
MASPFLVDAVNVLEQKVTNFGDQRQHPASGTPRDLRMVLSFHFLQFEPYSVAWGYIIYLTDKKLNSGEGGPALGSHGKRTS